MCFKKKKKELKEKHTLLFYIERKRWIITTTKNRKKNSSHKSSRLEVTHFEEGSLRIDEYYEHPLRKHKKEVKFKEAKVDLPPFYCKEDVEVYLDW